MPLKLASEYVGQFAIMEKAVLGTSVTKVRAVSLALLARRKKQRKEISEGGEKKQQFPFLKEGGRIPKPFTCLFPTWHQFRLLATSIGTPRARQAQYYISSACWGLWSVTKKLRRTSQSCHDYFSPMVEDERDGRSQH